MFTIWNKTNTALPAGSFTLAAGETRLVYAVPPELLDAIDKGFVEVSGFTQTTRFYDFTNGQRVAIGASSVQSSAINAREVLLNPTVDCFIRVGANPTAANAAGSMLLVAGEKFHLQLKIGEKVAVIQMTDPGFLFVLPTIMYS